MKISYKIGVLVFTGVLMTMVQFSIQRFFDHTIYGIEKSMHKLEKFNDSILNGMIEEKKYLNHHSPDDYENASACFRTACRIGVFGCGGRGEESGVRIEKTGE